MCFIGLRSILFVAHRPFAFVLLQASITCSQISNRLRISETIELSIFWYRYYSSLYTFSMSCNRIWLSLTSIKLLRHAQSPIDLIAVRALDGLLWSFSTAPKNTLALWAIMGKIQATIWTNLGTMPSEQMHVLKLSPSLHLSAAVCVLHFIT